MDKLWSPWRSKYISSFKDEKKDDSCIFCSAVNDNIEDENSQVVFSCEHCFVMLNLYPYNSGHLMVIPKRHLSDFTKLTSEEHSEIMSLTDKFINILTDLIKPHGFNFGANIGKAAGAGIDQHLHFHIVPRWNGDTNFMPILGEVKVISQDLIETKRIIRAALNK